MRPLAAAAGLAAAVLLAAGSACLAPDPPRPLTRGATPGPAFGAYLGAGAKGSARLGQWQLFSGAPAPYGIDFLPADSWASITRPVWLLEAWRAAGRRLVLSVPMLPMPPRPAGGDRATLERCSAGDYDDHWRTLAGTLLEQRFADAVVRPGWEFNGSWYAWAARGHERAFAGCFRRLVTAMRAVPGQHFAFVWNPTLGPAGFPAERAYPGDGYVDVIGVDVYDTSWQPETYPVPPDATDDERRDRAGAVWRQLELGDHGLRFWADFAGRHGLGLALPEWGLTWRADGHGGGDDPTFVRGLVAFVTDPANGVEFALYFDVDSASGRHLVSAAGTPFPRSARLLAELLAGLVEQRSPGAP